MALINLTPHELVLYAPDGQTVIDRIPASGTVARVKSKSDDVTWRFDQPLPVPVVKTTFGDVENLPHNDPDDVYIVSTLCLQAASQPGVCYDHAMVAPDTGPESVVRDTDGKILGVRRFQVL